MGILGDDILSNSILHDLFWTTEVSTPVRAELPEINWKPHPKWESSKEETEAWLNNGHWDELEHVKEQYEIKCDEIRGVHREMERLTKIILKHGLDKELELP